MPKKKRKPRQTTDSNLQVMAEGFAKRGLVRLRFALSVQNAAGQYFSWKGAGGIVDLPTTTKALQLVALLDETLSELCRQENLVYRRSYAENQSHTGHSAGGNTRQLPA